MVTHIPTRAQFRRVKGWRMPEGGVLATRPGPGGNPFKSGDRHKDVADFEVWARRALSQTFDVLTPEETRFVKWFREKARGATKLLCFCNITQACHVDVLRLLIREGY